MRHPGGSRHASYWQAHFYLFLILRPLRSSDGQEMTNPSTGGSLGFRTKHERSATHLKTIQRQQQRGRSSLGSIAPSAMAKRPMVLRGAQAYVSAACSKRRQERYSGL